MYKVIGLVYIFFKIRKCKIARYYLFLSNGLNDRNKVN